MIFFNSQVKDNESKQFAKNILKVKNFHTLIFYPFSVKSKQDPKFLKFWIPIEDFIKTVNENTKDISIKLTEDNVDHIILEPLKEKKMVQMLFYEKDIPVSFKVVSQMKKYEKLYFWTSFKNADKHVLERFNITKQPMLQLIYLTPGNDQRFGMIPYPGKIHYNDLSAFLNMASSESAVQEEVKVDRVNDQEEFDNVCNGQVCAIGLLDGNNEENYIKQYQLLKQLKQDKQFSMIQFLALDGECHDEIKLQTQSEQIPYLFIYLRAKQQFIPLFGTFELESLNIFIKKALGGKLSTQNLNSPIKINQKDCKEYRKFKQQKQDL